jgi:hypothetical protein
MFPGDPQPLAARSEDVQKWASLYDLAHERRYGGQQMLAVI